MIHTLPTLDPVTAMINRTIRALQDILDMTPDQFYAQAGISKGTYYNRMRGRGEWTASEVKRAADALGVGVAILYEGIELPHLDSNQKPAGFPMADAIECPGDAGALFHLDDYRRAA